MRDIKFRGKDIKDGQWVTGNLVKLATGSVYIIPQNVIANNIPQYAVDPDTVGELVYDNRFTGDILAVVCDCDSEYGCGHRDENWELAWHEQYFQYGLRRGERFVLLDEFGEENVHKIGNIHDNPELLTGGKENE